MPSSLVPSIRIIVVAGALATASGMCASSPAIAAKSKACTARAAEGTGITEAAAKFQAYEALLQATSWGAWAAWMTSGSTPGYKVNPVKYTCAKGSGLGVFCRGQTTICKL